MLITTSFKTITTITASCPILLPYVNPLPEQHVLRTVAQHRGDLGYYWRFHSLASRTHFVEQQLSATRLLRILRRSDGARKMRDEDYGSTGRRSPLFARLYNHITCASFFAVRGRVWMPIDIDFLVRELLDWRLVNIENTGRSA
jgi:hypothetical protein